MYRSASRSAEFFRGALLGAALFSISESANGSGTPIRHLRAGARAPLLNFGSAQYSAYTDEKQSILTV